MLGTCWSWTKPASPRPSTSTAWRRKFERRGRNCCWSGDWAQQGAVGPGGAFAMLAEDRGNPPELVEARRFEATWERAASAGAA